MRSASISSSTLVRLVIGCIVLCAIPRFALADSHKKFDYVASDRGCEASGGRPQKCHGNGKNHDSIDHYDFQNISVLTFTHSHHVVINVYLSVSVDNTLVFNFLPGHRDDAIVRTHREYGAAPGTVPAPLDVPEPTVLMTLSIGLGTLALLRRKYKA